MGKRERSIQSAIVDAAKKKYGKRIWIRVKHGDAYAVVGDPDIYGCLYSQFFGMEVKNEDNELTPIQQQRLKEIADADGTAGGVRSVEEGLQLLERTWPTL